MRALGRKVQLTKVALKQAHGGRKEGRQGYAAPPAVSSANTRDRSLGESERSLAGAVDNPLSNGIDSASFRVACAEQFFGLENDRGRNRAGFVMAPLSCPT